MSEDKADAGKMTVGSAADANALHVNEEDGLDEEDSMNNAANTSPAAPLIGSSSTPKVTRTLISNLDLPLLLIVLLSVQSLNLIQDLIYQFLK